MKRIDALRRSSRCLLLAGKVENYAPLDARQARYLKQSQTRLLCSHEVDTRPGDRHQRGAERCMYLREKI